MNLTRFSFSNRALVLAIVFVCFVFGAKTFNTMPRREDPEMTIRVALVITEWPGASARKVEDLITDPLETNIKKMDGVDEITSDSRTGLSIITVELDERITEIDQYWDELRNKVGEVIPYLPDGSRSPVVNSDFGDVYAVILALYQIPPPGGDTIQRPYTWRELEEFAETIQDDLKAIDMVAKVNIEGIQEEVIYLEVDSAEWAKIELTTDDLRQLLEARNIVAPGGQIDEGRARFTIKPTGEFMSVEQIGDILVKLQDGSVPVRLKDLPIRIVRGTVDPMTAHYRYVSPDLRSERCLTLAISMKSKRNIVNMGAAIDDHIEMLEAEVLPPDLELTRVNDLPRQVERSIGDFVTNLWQAILIVLAVALVMMGWRPAVIMAAAVPLCMIASILVVNLLGVELEQFSIASLIISLGMLVDNAIVVSDNALAELEKSGKEDREGSIIRGASELAVPILTSTLTTVAAFIPMLAIVGGVGEYTRSLPIVVATTLLISYLVAMMVTPIMCYWLLKVTVASTKPRVSLAQRVWRLVARKRATDAPAPVVTPAEQGQIYDKLVRWCLSHKAITLGAAGAAVVASLQLVPLIGNQFFPDGIRDQFFIHVWLPEGSSIAATSDKARQVEDILTRTSRTTIDGREVERLAGSISSVGSGGSRINLTTSPEQNLPNYAFILVNTTDALLTADWVAEVKAETAKIPGTRIDVRPFRLGPYIENPVEFRLSGPDHARLRAKAAQMIEVLRQTPGTVNPFHNWYNDGYQIDIEIDEEAANLAKVTNKNVADTMDSLISGGYLTTFREGDHQVPVLLRILPDKRREVLQDLGGIYVDGYAGKVPLDSIARIVPRWEPAVIARKDTIRTINLGCQVEPGFLSNQVTAEVLPRLESLMEDLPATYKLEVGGEAEETAESQAKLVGAFTFSFVLILLVLIGQYNSFIKPLIILSTVPLALIGALVGLYSTGWALGFMPSLGIIALAGVVINNAIILVDFIESNVRGGASLNDAVAQAGSQRMKPIILTTLTTVGGLLPLALFGGPMWAGMSWAMIFGLSLSTGLTLLVVPTIYAFCVETFKLKVA